MYSMEINKQLLEALFAEAKENPRLRQNFDLRTSSADTSQRMLNALSVSYTHLTLPTNREV